MEPELNGDEQQQQQDPLLKSGAFIDASRETNLESPKKTKEDASSSPATESVHTPPIDSCNATYVTPLSQWKPDAQPRQEASGERPSWLPGDWGFERKVRTSGATAGIVDRYFISPGGSKFRSKTEVVHFLEHGTKRKKTESGSTSTSAPVQKKEKKPKRVGGSKKGKGKENGKDFSNLKFDFTNPPQSVTWVPKDESENKWTPLVGNVAVPETEKAEWSEALDRVTEVVKKDN